MQRLSRNSSGRDQEQACTGRSPSALHCCPPPSTTCVLAPPSNGKQRRNRTLCSLTESTTPIAITGMVLALPADKLQTKVINNSSSGCFWINLLQSLIHRAQRQSKPEARSTYLAVLTPVFHQRVVVRGKHSQALSAFHQVVGDRMGDSCAVEGGRTPPCQC